MKRILAAILCLLIIISTLPAAAADIWEYTVKNGEVTLRRYAGPDGENLEIEIPKSIAGKKVTRLANGVFDGVSGIAVLEFPRKNVEIKDESLAGMENLTILCKDGGSVMDFCLEKGIEYEITDAETTPAPTEEPTISPTQEPISEPTSEPTVQPQPTELIIETKKVNLGKGDTWQISAISSPESPLTYKSRNKKIAKVDENGLVTAVKTGSTKIDVTTENGLSAVVKVKVLPAPDKITANPQMTTLGVGEKAAVSWSIPSGTAASVTFKSKNPAVAEISDDGVITALSEGKSKIALRTHNGKKASFTVTVKAAPTSITCDAPSIMGRKQKFTLKPVLSEGSSSKISYTSSDPSVAKVNSKGVITAKASGEAVIRISTYLPDIFCEIPLTVTEAPTHVSFGIEKLTLGVGEKYTLSPTTGGMGTAFTFKSSNKAIAKVSSKGVVTALGKGTAYITATTHNGISARLRVNVKAAPSEIRFQTKDVKLFYQDTFQLTWSIPKDSQTVLTFKSSDETIAAVDENGLVTGVSPGKCKITVTTANGKSDTCKVTAYDENYPISITMADERCYVKEGEKFTPELVVHPATADSTMTWKSSRKSVAEVAENGAVSGKAHGCAVITGQSTVNPDITITYEIVVLTDDRCLVLPQQRTSPDAIASNLDKIGNIHQSAINQLDILLAEGTIKQAEYSRRKQILSRAFDMYAFPFMVEEHEPYWRAANSEGGKKDFIPGTVYFGLPYVSGAGFNRQYNDAKAVSQGYYKKNGDHYVMNQKKRIGGTYVGNDCSSFVGMATWGAGSAYSYLRTSDIATTPVYTTVTDKTTMRPGDIINRPNAHSIIFLYYADKAKKQMVILEQGGRGEYTNTVWCSIVNLNTYLNSGYKIRRLRSW